MEYEVEFLEEPHIYLVNGIITPSVTQILEFMFPDKYKGISKEILSEKAKFGRLVHKGVEVIGKNRMNDEDAYDYIENFKFGFYEKLCIREYLKLRKKYKIVEIEQEIIVNFEDIYAGTLDMEADVDDEDSLIDIKTTSKLDKEYLSWQLSLYEKARGKKYKKFYCLWLPKKDIGHLIEIERKSDEEIMEKLKEYMEKGGKI